MSPGMPDVAVRSTACGRHGRGALLPRTLDSIAAAADASETDDDGDDDAAAPATGVDATSNSAPPAWAAVDEWLDAMQPGKAATASAALASPWAAASVASLEHAPAPVARDAAAALEATPLPPRPAHLPFVAATPLLSPSQAVRLTFVTQVSSSAGPGYYDRLPPIYCPCNYSCAGGACCCRGPRRHNRGELSADVDI